MSHSLSVVYIHLVFSTKRRHPFFRDPPLRYRLFQFMAGVSRKVGCPTWIVGGVEDHVHLLGRLGRQSCIADWVKEVKRASTVWLREQDPSLVRFAWQAGYGAFSVPWQRADVVYRYIATQEQHHGTMGFEEEYRRLLQENGVSVDERYLWD